MKKNILFFLCLIGCMSCFAFGEIGVSFPEEPDFEVDGICYKIIRNTNEIEVINMNSKTRSSYTGDVVIPEQVVRNGNTYTVTRISWGAFRRSELLRSVYIPATVEEISGEAFMWCRSLASVTLPEGITHIGKEAFSGCYALASIEIPNSIKYIGESAFLNCSELREIRLPDHAIRMGKNAFRNTAWYDEQPNGLVYAGNVLYDYKGNMPLNTELVIRKGTTGIAGGAFEKYGSLKSVIIPGSVEVIGKNAFEECKSLTSVELGNGVKIIGERAFGICENLSSVKLPSSVKFFEDYVFFGCTSLTSIRIPDEMTEINTNAFDYSGILSFKADKHSVFTSVSGVLFNKDKTMLIAYPPAKRGKYVVPETVRIIGAKAFEDCLITDVVFPPGLQSIEDNAFRFCENLVGVNIPDSTLFVGWSAFARCKNLKNVTLGRGLTRIESSCFSECGNLTGIIIPEGVVVIESEAFGYCSRLNSVKLPESVINFGRAFTGCESLKNFIVKWKQPPLVYNALHERGTFSFDIKNCKLIVPKGTLAAYQEAEGWKDFKIIEESHVD